MTETTVEEPMTEKPIHPALDFTANHAYVGQWLRMSKRSNIFTVIRDDGKLFPFHGANLESDDLSLKHNNSDIPQRWSPEGIHRFCRHEDAGENQALPTIMKQLRFYIELPDKRQYDFLALWNVGTYFHQLFNTYPYIYVSGTSQSGKSKLLSLCSCLSFNSVLTADMSTAVLYRLIQDRRCSLFVDEKDDLQTKYLDADFRRILLSGYRKGLEVYRSRKTEDGNFAAESFEVYGPKMLANIEGLEATLASRCITITMQRTKDGDISNREVNIDDSGWQSTRDQMYLLLMSYWKGVKQTYTEMQNDTKLFNRDWELWKPILALARFFGGTDIYDQMRSLAAESAIERQNANADPYEIAIVEALDSLVDHDDYYGIADIKRELGSKLEDREYVGSKQVGSLLRRFGFNKSKRMNSGYYYFLQLSKVKGLAQSFLVGEHGELGEATGGQGNKNTEEKVDKGENHP